MTKAKKSRASGKDGAIVQRQLVAIHGDGGVIGLTPDGEMAWSFNTPGMFRGKLVEDGQIQLGIYRDEP